MFSTGKGKTEPAASQERMAGGWEGRTIIIGPLISVGASAETQESSSEGSTSLGMDVVMRSCDASGSSGFGREDGSSSAARLRFFGFLSPLNMRGFGIILFSGVRSWKCGRAKMWCQSVPGVGFGFHDSRQASRRLHDTNFQNSSKRYLCPMTNRLCLRVVGFSRY